MRFSSIWVVAVGVMMALAISPHVLWGGQITVTWTFATHNMDGTEITDLAGARVYYGLSSGQYSDSIDVPGGEPGEPRSYTITGLQSGSTYYLNGTAYNTEGLESDLSEEIVRVAASVEPSISAWPTAAFITHGQTLAEATLSGGTASVPGTFAFVTPGAIPAAGTASHAVRFTPADTANYTTVDGTVSVTVNAVNQVPVVNAGPDGTAETGIPVTLQGSVTDDGLPEDGALTVLWAVVSGSGSATFADAGSAITAVTFASAGDYVLRLSASDGELSAAAEVRYVVLESEKSGQITVNWTFPSVNEDGSPLTDLVGARIYYGLSSGDYTASIDVPGGEPGETRTYRVTGLIEGATYYLNGVAYNTVGIESALSEEIVRVASPDEPSIPIVSAWPTATAITHGQTLAQATLSGGSASVPGTFAFVTPGAIPAAGTASHAVRFTPTDTANYTTVDGTVSVTVNAATANQPPVVDAGPDGTAFARTPIQMQGTVSDDGLPVSGQLTIQWTVIVSSGNVKIDNPDQPGTFVTFQRAGTHVLRLTASDGQLTTHDDVTFEVIVPPPSGLRVVD